MCIVAFKNLAFSSSLSKLREVLPIFGIFSIFIKNFLFSFYDRLEPLRFPRIMLKNSKNNIFSQFLVFSFYFFCAAILHLRFEIIGEHYVCYKL